MTKAQKVFCNEYLIDLNATRAYKVAYPKIKKDETINASSSRLLRNVKVQEYIEEKMRARENRTEITQDRVLKELAKIGFLDTRKLFNDAGNLIDVSQIDDDTAGAISGIEVFEEYEGYGENRERTGTTKKVKISDKVRALELMGKHLGMFKDSIEMNGNIEIIMDNELKELSK